MVPLACPSARAHARLSCEQKQQSPTDALDFCDKHVAAECVSDAVRPAISGRLQSATANAIDASIVISTAAAHYYYSPLPAPAPQPPSSSSSSSVKFTSRWNNMACRLVKRRVSRAFGLRAFADSHSNRNLFRLNRSLLSYNKSSDSVHIDHMYSED